jgi:hypothetical protein
MHRIDVGFRVTHSGIMIQKRGSMDNGSMLYGMSLHVNIGHDGLKITIERAYRYDAQPLQINTMI